MRRPLLLDLCCGEGGASWGYHLAGFDVVGVDNQPMPRYPFEFIQADALTVLDELVTHGCYQLPPGQRTRRRCLDLGEIAGIHQSWPCQKWALASRYNDRDYPDLITPARKLLPRLTVPWVMENVPKAPIRADYLLCGCMFGLELPGIGQLRRERAFETSWHGFDVLPPHNHWGPAISIAGHGTPSWMRAKTGHIGVAEWRKVMGIDWMTRDGLAEAIPPAYTEYIVARLLDHLSARDAA